MAAPAGLSDLADGLIEGPDGRRRCAWYGGHDDYMAYHDTEWGWPVTDPQRLFEKLCLEGFHSGLSWLTILRKRENFRAAFDQFDIEKMARYTDFDVTRLLGDAGIVRHRGKIDAVINNAQRACDMADQGIDLAAHIWSFEPGPDERPARADYQSLSTMTATASSAALSKDLKKRGWRFVGPTTVYAFMQSMGLVNDHLDDCFMREAVDEARSQLKRPSQ